MSQPNEAFSDPRLEAVRRWLLRYQPFIVTIAAVALIAIFLPGRTTQTTPEEASELSANAPDASVDAGSTEGVAAGAGSKAASTQAARSAVQGTGVLTFEEARKRGVELVANCDSATGRIKVPSRFAAPCVQKHVGPNAGATWKGVTDNKIVVVVYRSPENPAAEAILAAAGANDSDEEEIQQHREWAKYYSSHYNLWGRKIDLRIVESSATEATDDAAGKADAIKVAEEIKAFASLGGLNNTYAREVMARGTMCFDCQVSQPAENYLKSAPYSWATLSASTFLYVHRAEYVGKRLAKGRKAIYAYDDINPAQGFKTKPRKFGLLYYETKDYAYKAGADFFVKELAKYGVKLTVKAQYNGFPDLAANQEQSRPLIQKLKEAGVTSVICACDPFGPIFFTQEATRQLYGPEWIITGSALTDTAFFGRLYDQDQWEHAFGLSALFARMPEKYSDSYRLLYWQYNKEPTARAGYGIIRAPHGLFFTGVHLAGSKLTPKTFEAGMFNLPVTGRGSITMGTVSFGRHGFWPMADYTAFDDMTEIWWDREAEGETENGIDGTGLYRYVDGGKRFMPTEYPSTNVKPFVKAGTVLIYDKAPKQDQWPCYESPATHRKDRC